MFSKVCHVSDWDDDWFVKAESLVKSQRVPTGQVEGRKHRKYWEQIWLIANLQQSDLLKNGMRGIGFGVGREWIGQFLTRFGVHVTLTDGFDPGGWASTGQHASSLRDCCFDMDDFKYFSRYATFDLVDMNAIPPYIGGYDFAWSLCSLDHLGSRHLGRMFIWNTLNCIRKGGKAFHTTEFSLNDAGFDSPALSVFTHYDLHHLSEVQASYKAKVAPIDHSKDQGDLNGYSGEWPSEDHLRVHKNGSCFTSVGMAIEKCAS